MKMKNTIDILAYFGLIIFILLAVVSVIRALNAALAFLDIFIVAFVVIDMSIGLIITFVIYESVLHFAHMVSHAVGIMVVEGLKKRLNERTIKENLADVAIIKAAFMILDGKNG
ncbi:MAG: hypothetical protein ACTSPL_04135 [Candidatus Odinarchaeia archaeon]